MNRSLSPADWVRILNPLKQPRLRLFCLPHAGGDAGLFRAWPPFFPAGMIEICPIQLPGRAERLRETPFTRVSALIDVLVPPRLEESPLFPLLDRPLAICGCSLGALIGFELARSLRARHDVRAAALVVAACRAPHLPRAHGGPPAEKLDDAAVIELLRRRGGTPEHVFGNRKLMQFILPKMQADLQMACAYSYQPGVLPLDCPITVFGGDEDPLVGLEDLLAWRAHTSGAFDAHLLPGDHFFVRDTATLPCLLAALAYTLEEALAAKGGQPVAHAVGLTSLSGVLLL